jgi:hypothetical protein
LGIVASTSSRTGGIINVGLQISLYRSGNMGKENEKRNSIFLSDIAVREFASMK